MTFVNDSVTIDGEPWFIPIDIFEIVCFTFAVLLSLFFLFIIIFDKTCHTVPMLLVANSCLAELFFGCDTLAMSIFTLRNDLKQIYYYDIFCLLHACAIYMSTLVQNYSYVLQAIYRYFSIVYPTRLFWRSAKFQLLLISLTWIGGITYPIPLVFTNQIKYIVDDQICQMPLNLSFMTIFNGFHVYFNPMSIIMITYVKMIRYVREMHKRVTPVNTLLRAQRELRMIRRIISLVLILVALGLPYTIFIFMSFFNRAPKYHFRIAYIFVDASLALVMVALFQVTEPLKASVMKRINERRVIVAPTVA